MNDVPWHDLEMVSGATDLVAIVREPDLDMARTSLAQIPAEVLIDLAIVLAAMVDDSKPLSAMLAWAVPHTAAPLACGHSHTEDNTRVDIHGRQQCRTCDRNRRRQAAKASAA